MILIIGSDDQGAIYIGIYDDKRENEKNTIFSTFTYLWALDKNPVIWDVFCGLKRKGSGSLFWI